MQMKVEIDESQRVSGCGHLRWCFAWRAQILIESENLKEAKNCRCKLCNIIDRVRSMNFNFKHSYTCASTAKAKRRLKQINENDDHCGAILAECDTEIEDDKNHKSAAFLPPHFLKLLCRKKISDASLQFSVCIEKAKQKRRKKVIAEMFCVCAFDNGCELLSLLFWNLRHVFLTTIFLHHSFADFSCEK